jgi:hypothetical protein
VHELTVGQTEDAETEALKASVPDAVVLEGGAVCVVAKPVGLHDQGPFAPDEVDLVRADATVHLRLGKAVATADDEEAAL